LLFGLVTDAKHIGTARRRAEHLGFPDTLKRRDAVLTFVSLSYADDLRRVWAVERPFALHLDASRSVPPG
jgi:hypothetical protein